MDKIDNPSSIESITIKSIPILLNKSGFKFPSSLIRRILVEFSLKVKIYRSCGGIGHAGSGLVPRFPDPSSRLPLPPCPSLRMHRRACTRLLNARSIFSCRAIRDASAVFATPSPLYSIPLLPSIFPLGITVLRLNAATDPWDGGVVRVRKFSNVSLLQIR